MIESERIDDTICGWRIIRASQGNLTFAEVASAWRSHGRFRDFWVGGLAALPFDAYCWECAPVYESNIGRSFECVFVSSPSLAGMGIDRDTFGEHFRPGCDVVTFDNLGGDATLVAPCPGDSGDFSHLASFTATATPERQDALWRAVGEALASRIGPRPLWLSTAGHGVAWLHVRLDSRPKYYRHRPYMKV